MTIPIVGRMTAEPPGAELRVPHEPDEEVPARGRGHADLRALAQRVFYMLVVLWLVSIGVFALAYAAPGGPVAALSAGRPLTASARAALEARYHLHDSVLTQYGSWLAHAVRFDFGMSFRSNETVGSIIASRGLISAELALLAFVIALAVALPLAIVAATRRRTALDRTISAAAAVGIATPPFAVAVLLLYLFGVELDWFPIFGAGTGFLDRLHHLVLPALALATGLQALLVKVTRAALITVLDQEYVTFARARGLSRRRVVLTYALRNTTGPIATAAGLTLATLVASTALVEQAFAIPGIGAQLVDAVNNEDIPVIQGISLTLAAVILVINLLTDVVYVALDARLHLAESLT